jgi:transposase
MIPARRPGHDRDEVVEHRRRKSARLREELARAERARRDIERERDRLKRQNERLKQQLDAAGRAGFRQAAPFRKDRPQGRGGGPGRRAGPGDGRRGPRRVPRRVDARDAAPLPAGCPTCGGRVRRTRVAAQYEEDLPLVRPVAAGGAGGAGRGAAVEPRVDAAGGVREEARGAAARAGAGVTRDSAEVLRSKIG